MSVFVRVSGVMAVIAMAAACGGGGSSYTPPAPSPQPTQSPPPSNAATIRIVGESGPEAFNPNPAALPESRRVAWRNDDGVVHRIVANDGSFDTGNIGPGASSTAFEVPASGSRFHCSLHPTMVGAVAGSTGEPPPCTGIYC